MCFYMISFVNLCMSSKLPVSLFLSVSPFPGQDMKPFLVTFSVNFLLLCVGELLPLQGMLILQ